jgi:hypothetical protein
MKQPPQFETEADVLSEVEGTQLRLADILQGVTAEEHMGRVFARARDSRARLARIFARGEVTVCGGALAPGDLAQALGVEKVNLITFDNFVAGTATCNLLIVNHHPFFQNADAQKALERAAEDPDFISAVWFRDHHHIYRRNLELARQVDFVFPGHQYKHEYLRATNMNVLSVIPMCCGQWPDRMLAQLFEEALEKPRSDALYGGYGFYPRYRARTAFIDRIGAEIPGSKVVQWRPAMEGNYLSLSQEDRFRDWLSYKVSAVVNTDFCVPNRVFDALAAGQIPLVPHGLSQFEAVIPADAQRALPVIRYSDFDIESLRSAYAQALEAFETGGRNAMIRRHMYTRRFHTYTDRARRMLRELRRIAEQAN